MDVLCHPGESRAPRSRGRRRLSTIGHGDALRAFATAARRARVRFMVIGGTFRDALVQPGSTQDIDVVLLDCERAPAQEMRETGFRPVRGESHAWRYSSGDTTVELQVAALARSSGSGPFSVAFRHARLRSIEGVRVRVPRTEDWVILKLLAAASDRRRLHRDLRDLQLTLERFPDAAALRIPALRARLRDTYGVSGRRLRELIGLLRHARTPISVR